MIATTVVESFARPLFKKKRKGKRYRTFWIGNRHYSDDPAYAAYIEGIKQATPTEEFDFIHTEVIADRKSKFQAHLARVTSQEQVEQALTQQKIQTKIDEAAYYILAYRIFDKEKNSYLNNEGRDDGENEANKRLLHLLQICKVKDVVVIVTYWHGDVNIGPDRFKHINACALEVIKMATEAGTIHIGAPIEIVCRGPQAFAAYENALLNGKTKNQRLFLMLIGPSRSGKTSLLKSFKGEVFDPDEDSTDVIALHRYCCKLIDGTWVKDSASEDEISFESVMSQNIAKHYQTVENSQPQPAVEREEKRSTSADGSTNFDYNEIDEKSHPVGDIEGSSNAKKSFVNQKLIDKKMLSIVPLILYYRKRHWTLSQNKRQLKVKMSFVQR
ncbi:Protein IMPACT [Exaiptasia diaphana]|nr:Protein IMPACT [Exaiptasia diaphana]